MNIFILTILANIGDIVMSSLTSFSCITLTAAIIIMLLTEYRPRIIPLIGAFLSLNGLCMYFDIPIIASIQGLFIASGFGLFYTYFMKRDPFIHALMTSAAYFLFWFFFPIHMGLYGRYEVYIIGAILGLYTCTREYAQEKSLI